MEVVGFAQVFPYLMADEPRALHFPPTGRGGVRHAHANVGGHKVLPAGGKAVNERGMVAVVARFGDGHTGANEVQPREVRRSDLLPFGRRPSGRDTDIAECLERIR